MCASSESDLGSLPDHYILILGDPRCVWSLARERPIVVKR